MSLGAAVFGVGFRLLAYGSAQDAMAGVFSRRLSAYAIQELILLATTAVALTFLLWAVFVRLAPLAVTATVDDTGIRLVYQGGRVRSVKWSDPRFRVDIRDIVSRHDPPRLVYFLRPFGEQTEMPVTMLEEILRLAEASRLRIKTTQSDDGVRVRRLIRIARTA